MKDICIDLANASRKLEICEAEFGFALKHSDDDIEYLVAKENLHESQKRVSMLEQELIGYAKRNF